MQADIKQGEPLVLQEELNDGGLPQYVHHVEAQLVPVGIGGEVRHVPNGNIAYIMSQPQLPTLTR